MGSPLPHVRLTTWPRQSLKVSLIRVSIAGSYTDPTPVIQIMISQIIIGNRTWAITRRSKKLGLFLLGLGLVVTGLEWYANVDGRIPVQEAVRFPV